MIGSLTQLIKWTQAFLFFNGTTAFILVLVFSASAKATEFFEEEEKEIPLRSLGSLRVINPRGDLTFQPWSKDRIRLKVRKKVVAASSDEARKLLAGVSYRYDEKGRQIEISTQYGKDLSLEETLAHSETSKVQVDFLISAPPQLSLVLWNTDGKTWVSSWNGSVEARSKTGLIQFDGLKGHLVSATCPSCEIVLRNIRSSIQCLSSHGKVDADGVFGKTIFLETQDGLLRISHSEGEQLLTSTTGNIEGRVLKGKIAFHTNKGQVELDEVSGFLSGISEGGNIIARVKEWTFADKALIESNGGAITLYLPSRFSGRLDIESLHGEQKIELPYRKITESRDLVVHSSGKRVFGQVREGLDILKVSSQTGDIQILKYRQ